MVLPAGNPPWFGLDEATLRFLEVHQTRAVAIPGRAWRDFGDCVMLFSAGDRDPFFNRLTAVRWPSDRAAFDARLAETQELFFALDRQPHVWTIPDLTTPSDIVERLKASGFVDLGGGYDMLLVRDPGRPDDPHPPMPPGAVLERWHRSADSDVPERAEALALVIGEAFDVPIDRRPNLAVEVGLTLGSNVFHAYLLTIDGEPVATGQRYSFDGASYLSSIGTRPRWRHSGLAAIVTRALAQDAVADGSNLVYLGVHADNEGAIRLYERLGFAILGGRSADLLLR